MFVFLFDIFKQLLLRKTDVPKTCWKINFSERKFKDMH